MIFKFLFWFRSEYIRRRDQLFTHILRPMLKHCGRHVSFQSPSTISGLDSISIGDCTTFNRYSAISALSKRRDQKFYPELTIGSNCCFGEFNNITCVNKVSIGNNVLTGRWVTITDNSHGKTDIKTLAMPPSSRDIVSPGAVNIEDDVWIGDKVTILPNVRIGKGAVIAANAVVTKDIPSYSVVAGIPAKNVKNKLFRYVKT